MFGVFFFCSKYNYNNEIIKTINLFRLLEFSQKPAKVNILRNGVSSINVKN